MSQLIILCTSEFSEACNLHCKLYTLLLIHVWQLFTPELANMHSHCAASHRQAMQNSESVIVRYNKVIHTRLSKYYIYIIDTDV